MSEFDLKKTEDQPEPFILTLDTASKLTGIVVSSGAKIIGNFSAALDETRSTKLWEIIDFLLGTIGLKIEQIELFAACTGPGGFTGVRVGLAAAKAFAAATGKLTVGVTSLEAYAAAVHFAPQVYSLINAYKGEVYSQLFSFDEYQMPVAQNEALVGPLDKALERVATLDKLILIGDAASVHADSIKKFNPIDWNVQNHSGFLAEQVAQLAYYKYQAGKAVKADALQATYVRGADIKIKAQA